MKITKEAIEFFYRMFFSCYDRNKKSSRENREVIERHLVNACDMVFDDFCMQLQNWDARKKAIEMVARELGKKAVDKEVLAIYFGSPHHTEIVVDELLAEGVSENGKFYRYTIFNHMLVPLKVVRVAEKVSAIVGVYENKDISVPVNYLLFSEKDRMRIEVGKVILCHYPMVIDADPDPEILKSLLELHRSDKEFMRAIQSFPDGIDHAEFNHLSVLRKEMS